MKRNTMILPITQKTFASGSTEKSSPLRKAAPFSGASSVMVGDPGSSAAAGLSGRDRCRARYFSKTIPHRRHSVLPSGCTIWHFGHFIVRPLSRTWRSRFPLHPRREVLSISGTAGRRGGGASFGGAEAPWRRELDFSLRHPSHERRNIKRIFIRHKIRGRGIYDRLEGEALGENPS